MSFAPPIDASSSSSSPMFTASEITVRQSSVSRTQLGANATPDVAARIAMFLRSVHPTKTADNVAADTGIPAKTVAKYLDRGSAPGALAFCRLMQAYGAPFACAAMENPPAWLNAAAREDDQRRLRAEIAALEAKLNGGKGE